MFQILLSHLTKYNVNIRWNSTQMLRYFRKTYWCLLCLLPTYMIYCLIKLLDWYIYLDNMIVQKRLFDIKKINFNFKEIAATMVDRCQTGAHWLHCHTICFMGVHLILCQCVYYHWFLGELKRFAVNAGLTFFLQICQYFEIMLIVRSYMPSWNTLMVSCETMTSFLSWL